MTGVDDELENASGRLLEKVRAFAAELDAVERQLFAALLAPGVAAAWAADENEVEGFGTVWSETQLHTHLRDAIRSHGLRIESD